jgi:hypothetical protein
VRRVWLLAILALLLLPRPVWAGELTLGYWQATGQQGWHIVFPTTGGSGASELYYPQRVNYLTATYENELSPTKRLRLEVGFGGVKAATGTDSDWDYGQKPDLWYFGDFRTSGNSGFVNIDLVRPGGGTSEYFIGYSYRKNNMRMTDGVYYTENYAAQNPVDILTGLNSTYSATYQGPHVGIAGSSPVSKEMSVVGSLAYTPLAFYEGHGSWNLRNLEFSHTASAQMVDAYVGVHYKPGGLNVAVNAGYRYQWLSVYRGWEDTSADITLDKATNVQQGFYFSTEYKF